MSDQRVLSSTSDTAGMSRMVIRLTEHPTPAQLERAREQIFSRLVDSSKGLVIDCHEIGRTSVAALSMLQSAKNFASSEGKRLTLYKIGKELSELLREHASVFQFDVYGSKPLSVRQSSGASPAPSRISPQMRRIFRNIVVPVMIVLPLVGAIEYFFVFRSATDVVKVVKTFEFDEDAFIIEGIVEIVVGGTRIADEGAVVTVWPEEPIPELGNRGWVTTTDSDGRFELPLEFGIGTQFVQVNVAVTSKTANDQSSREAVDPERRTQVSNHIMRHGKRLKIKAIFF